MKPTADKEAAKSRRWTPITRIAAIVVSLPFLAYAPGFVMALPFGVATSLPFYATANDYTCSSELARSVMVRVWPYEGAKAVRAGRGAGERCARIESFGERDLAGADPAKPDSGFRFVRIYTPSRAARAKLPSIPTPDDMSSRVISLRSERQQAAPAPQAANKPAQIVADRAEARTTLR